MARDPARRPFVNRVLLDPAALSDMLQHAREDAPNECCGLLVGQRGAIISAFRARNLEAGPTRYTIDPQDHFAAIHAARSRGLQVIGAYHSHPSGSPMPSDSDIAEATGGRDFLYVIVSLRDAEVRAYRLENGEVDFLEVIAS